MGRASSKIFQKNKELERKDFKRSQGKRKKLDDIIIACEDETSSPAYFKMIIQQLKDDKKITPISFVIAKHKHSNPLGVLEDLKNHECDDGRTYKNFKHKWIVIDRDIERVNGGGHTKQDFNNALQEARRLKVDVAYCNDSFELWYLLHFGYRDTAIVRDSILKQVIDKLKRLDPISFKDLDKDSIKKMHMTEKIFEVLFSKQCEAIQNSEKLLAFHGDEHNPEKDNPSTTVHKLVEVLNSLNK